MPRGSMRTHLVRSGSVLRPGEPAVEDGSRASWAQNYDDLRAADAAATFQTGLDRVIDLGGAAAAGGSGFRNVESRRGRITRAVSVGVALPVGPPPVDGDEPPLVETLDGDEQIVEVDCDADLDAVYLERRLKEWAIGQVALGGCGQRGSGRGAAPQRTSTIAITAARLAPRVR